MRLARRRRSGALLLLLCASCAGTARAPGSAARGESSPPTVRSEEEYAAARAEFDALPPLDPQRAPRRRALADYLLRECGVALDRAHPDDAEPPFKQALSLYSFAELRDAARPGARNTGEAAGLLATARRYEAAFRKRGAHEQVVMALGAQISVAPLGDPESAREARRRYDEVVAWLEGTPGARSDEDSREGAARLVEDLEATVRVLSSPFLVDELARRYRGPAPPAPRGGRASLRALREMIGEEPHGPRAYELARVFLRVGDPARARAELTAMQAKEALRGDDSELLQLLEKVLAKETSATDWVGLAMFVVRQTRERGVDDRDVALRVCRDAEARFEHAIEPRLCTGQLASSLDQLVVAMRSFEQVRALDPTRREAWEALARIYQTRLFQVVTEENLDVARLPSELSRVEAFHAEAQKRFAQQPLQPGLAGAVFEVGRGYYNAGRIDDAEKYLARSIALEVSPAALELAATVRQKRGDPQRAAVLLERAMNLGHGPKEEQLYRRAKLRRLLADAFSAAGDEAGAERTRRGAVEDWDVLVDLGLQKEFAAEALLERGKVLYQLGERDEALRSLARSIDAVPDRGSTYADVIAFLVPRGELAEVLDAYHRALGRSEVTDYLKVYCSLWIVDLAQRSGQPEDPLALAYLHAADGAKWYDDLARWATGREPEQELLTRASTPGRRAEAAFYRAMKSLRAGRPDEAKQLWGEVLKTDMMAFFEYDMAGMYLKDGAPAVPRIAPTAKPTQPPPARPGGKPALETPRHGDPLPDGSI